MSKFIADEPVVRIGKYTVTSLGDLNAEKEALAKADARSLEPTDAHSMGCAQMVPRRAPVAIAGKIGDNGEWSAYYDDYPDLVANPLRRRNNRPPSANCTESREHLRYGRFVAEQIARAFDDNWRAFIDADTSNLLLRLSRDCSFWISYTEVLDGCHIKSVAEHCIGIHRQIMAGESRG
jgi:hypothetical protein